MKHLENYEVKCKRSQTNVNDCNNFGIETGLYFGKKDSYSENKNIYVNGEITKEEEIIKWEIKKI